ncbi:1-phosphofructokinase [Anaeromyxobacter oryzae]|uniref:Phosphofructokinase n=1 Tax=Anaeromyxobacter oryzae TaxID=2918170 RepID=A0ABM7WPR0_9BACT|nr:1-phosphofructokinase [Anaeromyxobacter oryzae]BDG01448.1 phosphofructokinase [Anaeromyxobacter oryzae]
MIGGATEGAPGPRARVATLTLHPALDQTVTLERLTPGAVHQAEGMRFDAGGKGVNVAAFLADAGVTVAATGLLGEDNAAAFTALFAAKGIEDQFVRVPGTTRINVKLVETSRRETTDINLPAARAPVEALDELDRRVLALAERCAWFVLAGSVPAGVPPDVYADIIARLRARGCRVAVDTSGAPLAHALSAAPDLAKPNRAELEQLVGEPLPTLAEVARAARDLRRRGPRLVVVSMGAEGALFTGEEGAWLARPPAVGVATTVGAGDALVAGLVASLLRGDGLEQAARRATAFAAAKVGRVGPHLGPADAVRALEARVDVHSFRED